MQNKGLIHLYTGTGKGKTTASVGLAVRATGAGKKVVFAQLMKGRDTSELTGLRELGVQVLRQNGAKKFVFQMNDEEKAAYRKTQTLCFQEAVERAQDSDLLILDEVVSAVTTGMVAEKDLVDFLQHKPEGLEVVLTGRDAPESLRQLADYITNMQAEKHPYEQGVPARLGIEF